MIAKWLCYIFYMISLLVYQSSMKNAPETFECWLKHNTITTQEKTLKL